MEEFEMRELILKQNNTLDIYKTEYLGLTLSIPQFIEYLATDRYGRIIGFTSNNGLHYDEYTGNWEWDFNNYSSDYQKYHLVDVDLNGINPPDTLIKIHNRELTIGIPYVVEDDKNES
ncbi:hypothetical protein QE177_04365 [Arsenophonus sp. aPb]|uniref:hypothetical protein n=1 Tax=Arsenophonus sp. aPb TaxID=3041619 RepID=UPI002469B8AB|nr:hypothetical protein [Arsenophonus sp. aPb]WGL99121.1 hypothetical protein QE177_04365 [Arsenophonus sp. aPb]